MDREARKRKLVSREADRMALITDRILRLDPDPFSKFSSFSTRPIPNDNLPAQHAPSTSEPGATNDQVLLRDNHHGQDDKKDLKEVVSPIRVPNLQKHEEKEIANNETQSSIFTSNNTSDQTNFATKTFNDFLNSISPREINQSIISSETTRVICSIAVAFLVVLSHFNLSHNVVKPKSLISYQPLYVVLLTDVLVVAARLSVYVQRKKEVKEQKFDEGGENWGAAIKLLELGLVVHQIVRALFIDCSFYLVIVVCGLSFV